MKKEVRTFCFDEELQIEAYRFEKILHPFPNHFHDHYVVGFIREGKRKMSCGNKQYELEPGDITLFNPGQNHACLPVSDLTMNYYGLNINPLVMEKLVEEITGTAYLPSFTQPLISDTELHCHIYHINEMIMEGSEEFEKEELLLCLISLLIEKYSQPFSEEMTECLDEIESACRFIEDNYAAHMTLDDICKAAALSKSTLLRAFTRTKGITPYRYLETIRINRAKELLEQGVSPIDTAIQTGFSDQSHFNRFFRLFIGVTPGVYRDIFEKRG